MNYETAEAYALGTYGLAVGVIKEAKREIIDGNLSEKAEVLALTASIGVLAVAGYGMYKNFRRT